MKLHRMNRTIVVAALSLLCLTGCKSQNRKPPPPPREERSNKGWNWLPFAKQDKYDNALARRLRPLLHSYDTSGAIVSARVIDLSSGKELYAERADEPFIPASNNKLPVSAAALDRVGIDHTFQTYLAYDGEDIWLIGTGDPATGDPRLAKKYGQKP